MSIVYHPYQFVFMRARRPSEQEETPPIPRKGLGDGSYKHMSQTVGMYAADGHNIDATVKLARGYIFEGKERSILCEMNGELAQEVGRLRETQVWFLLAAALRDLTPTPPPAPVVNPPSPKPAEGLAYPTMPSTSYSFPSTPESQRNSPAHRSHDSYSKRYPSSSTSRRITPASSGASSPVQGHISLPLLSNSRQPYLGRRESVDSNASSLAMRRPSVFRRASTSIHTSSPMDRNMGSLRHVGEGALDDSDSSSSDDNALESSDENGALPSLTSPALRPNAAHPSPLSRIAGTATNRWAEDEDDQDQNDEASPSPPTDSDSETGSIHRVLKTPRSSRRTASHRKSRSRSSTLASLAASAIRPALSHRDSKSSIKTVTADESPMTTARELKAEDTIRPIPPPLHQRHKSQAVSELMLDSRQTQETLALPEKQEMSSREVDIVRQDEAILRDMVWDSLREAVEVFADDVGHGFPIVLRLTFRQGDVQMCTMLGLIAPEELRIRPLRMACFLDSYISCVREYLSPFS